MNTSNPILHLVVHHPKDSHQPWVNCWIDDETLEAITTTLDIGRRCSDAMELGDVVRIHRCGWGDCAPSVCCEVKVVQSAPYDKRTYLIGFELVQALGTTPKVSPHPGQNYYVA